jgi:hypothetical protein
VCILGARCAVGANCVLADSGIPWGGAGMLAHYFMPVVLTMPTGILFPVLIHMRHVEIVEVVCAGCFFVLSFRQGIGA